MGLLAAVDFITLHLAREPHRDFALAFLDQDNADYRYQHYQERKSGDPSHVHHAHSEQQ